MTCLFIVDVKRFSCPPRLQHGGDAKLVLSGLVLMFVETALFNYYTVLDLEDVRLQLRTFEDTHMQIKFWLSTIVNSILKRFPRGMSRHQRLKRRLGLRASVAVLTVVATIPLLEHTAAGQCEGPLFPEAVSYTHLTLPTIYSV